MIAMVQNQIALMRHNDRDAVSSFLKKLDITFFRKNDDHLQDPFINEITVKVDGHGDARRECIPD